MLNVDIATIPEGGMHLEGELDKGVFGLEGDRDVVSNGPLKYNLDLELFDDELFVSGEISATFIFRCARCLKEFEQTIEIKPLQIAQQLDSKNVLDLSDALREEIVLEFPAYPNCQNADKISPCELDKTYLVVDKSDEDGVKPPSPDGDQSIWDALNTLEDHNSDNNKS